MLSLDEEEVKSKFQVTIVNNSINKFIQMKGKTVSLSRFGWINCSTLGIKFEPPLDEFEILLKDSFKSTFKLVENFEQIFGICNLKKNYLFTFFYLDNKKKFDLSFLNSYLSGFSKQLEETLIWSFYEPIAILAIFFFFEFLFIQKKTYVSDVISEFKVYLCLCS